MATVPMPSWATNAGEKMLNRAQKVLDIARENPGESAASAIEFAGILISMLVGSSDPESGRNVMLGSLAAGNTINAGVQGYQVLKNGEDPKQALKDWGMRALGGLGSVGIEAVTDAVGAPKGLGIPFMATAEVLATRASMNMKHLAGQVRAAIRERDAVKKAGKSALENLRSNMDGLAETHNELAVALGEQTIVVQSDQDGD